MALKKSVPTDSGAPADYVRIRNVSVDREGGVQINVGIYVSKATRDANKVAVAALNYQFSFADLGVAAGELPTLEQIYTTLKARPEWTDATDV
jgi:hypothetical protein